MKWTNEQKEAIDTDGNIIVSAGAGSGKTAVLSERVIRKLKEGVHINQLLLLTFTEAAAKEMKDRIRKKIIENKLLDELLYIDSAYITTFDSYAYSLVKKYYYLLNINPDIGIITNLEIEKKQILDDIFEQKYLSDTMFESMISDFCTKDDENIKKYILNIAEKISLNIDYNNYLKNYIYEYYNEEFINKNIKAYINLNIDYIKNIKLYLEKISFLDSNEYYNKIYDTLMPLLNSKTYEEFRTNSIIKLPNLPKNSSEEIKKYKELINDSIKSINKHCKYENLSMFKEEILNTKKYALCIVEILKEYFQKLNEYKNSINRYEFNDISHMAIELIKNNEDVKNDIKSSFNEIMIDEYQDTNDIQEYFISLISNNNVYMVGDIKQSIYRFRNANPLIFKNKYENYSKNIDGKKIDLNKNFRSREEVLTDINKLFNPLMDIEYGGADYFSSHQLIYGNKKYDLKNKQDYSINILRYSDNEYTKEEQEIFIMADDILNKINNNYKILDNEKLRNVTYDDFAILVDRSKNFDLIKKIFEYKKIPLCILKDESINNSVEIYLFKNIINLLIKYNKKEYDIDFKYSLISILRSYLIKYNDQQIFDIISSDNLLNNIVIEKISKIKITSINKILNDIIKEFDIYSTLVNVGNIEEKNNLINYILTLGEEKTTIGYDIYDFNNYLNELLKNKIDIKYNVQSSTHGVKLMTIFKSKGLEFPICYMPFLYVNFNISDLKELITYSTSLGIILPYLSDGIKNTFYKDILKNQYIKDEISEKIRLFYVALTRAKEKLILIQYNDNKEKIIEKFQFKSFKDFIDYLDNYVQYSDILTNVDKNYNIIKKLEKINIESDIIEINDINIEKKEKEIKNFSHKIEDIIDKKTYEDLEYGNELHERLEEFAENDILVKKLKMHSELGNFDKVKIYHEYEFLDNDNKGIIDMMLEYDNIIKIIDFKANDIDKEEYNLQIKGYYEYISSLTNKKVEAFLYSIIKDKLKKII